MFDFLRKGNKTIRDPKLEKIRLALEKKEQSLKEKERLIRHAEALEEELARYKEYEEEITRKTAEWKNAEKIFADERKVIENKKKALKEKEDSLKKREAKVAERGKEFELREEELLRHESALEKSEERVRLTIAQLESKKLQLEEHVLAQKRLIADGQKELSVLEAQKEAILVQKHDAEVLFDKNKEVKRILADKDAMLKNKEAELLNSIKAFELGQSVRLREVDKKIQQEERASQDSLGKLEKEYAVVDFERVELEKTINSQHELLASLEIQCRDVETRLNEKQAKIDAAKKELASADAGLKDFENMQWELEKKRHALEKQERSWEKQFEASRQKLRQKEVEVLQRERALASQASSVASRERQLASIRAEKAELEKQKQEAFVVLKQRESYEAEMRRLAGENEKKLNDVRIEMERLHVVRDDFKKKEQLEKALSKARDELIEQKSIVQNDAARMRESLALISKERENKLDGLRSEFVIMKKEKQKIEALVEKDMAVLKEKENEVVKMLDDFEKERQRLEAEENIIVKRVHLFEREKKQHETVENKLNEREKFIKSCETELEKQGEYIARVIERQKNLDDVEQEVKQLEKQKSELEAWMKRVSSELLIEPPVDKEKFMKEEPGVVSEIEENPDEALGAIARLQVKKERGLAKTSEVDVEIKKIIQKKIPVLMRKEGPARLNILLVNAKDKISSGQIGEAKILIREAEMLLGRVKDAELRRNYGYDLKELKTNMKLAVLA
ncbi:hypothetical protein HY485_03055 [Candidatus Woesearchaeota archaeon]|nr:hypothetical protein [Candidatus Woesearchaeota archaeon]